MKFLKNNLKVIIAFILGLILAGGIVYAATSADKVTYTTAKNTEIKNVGEALNDLYKIYNKDIELVGMYKSTNWVPRASTHTLTIQNVEPGTYLLVTFRTLSGGNNDEEHLAYNEISSMTNASYSKIDGGNNTVYRVSVTETNDITINYPVAAANNNSDGGYTFAYLFK